MATPSLAIAIPSYRRAAILSRQLEAMLPKFRAARIAIYVSDDSPDDETAKAVEALRNNYSHIHYRKNEPSRGHDDNLIATLTWPTEDYVWLIGDGGMATPAGLDALFKICNDQDFIFVNSHAEGIPSVNCAEGADALALTRELLWHQTLTGATIYHRRVIDWARTLQPRDIKRNFPQLSVILGYASVHSPKVAWIEERGVAFSDQKKSYWKDAVFPIFVDDLHNAISSYPAVIGPADYPMVMRSHSQRTGLLGARNLAWLRAHGRFSRRDLAAFPNLFAASSASPATIKAIAHLPEWLFQALGRLKHLLGKPD